METAGKQAQIQKVSQNTSCRDRFIIGKFGVRRFNRVLTLKSSGVEKRVTIRRKTMTFCHILGLTRRYRLERCYIGKLLKAMDVQVVKESFILGGLNLVRVRYLRERYMLLSCDEDGLIERIIADNKEGFKGIFNSMVPGMIPLWYLRK